MYVIYAVLDGTKFWWDADDFEFYPDRNLATEYSRGDAINTILHCGLPKSSFDDVGYESA